MSRAWSLCVFTAMTLIVAIEAAEAATCCHPGPSAEWVRSAVVFGLCPRSINCLQGGALQHELAAGLEGRSMAGRLMAFHSRWARSCSQCRSGHAGAAPPQFAAVYSNLIPTGLHSSNYAKRSRITVNNSSPGPVRPSSEDAPLILLLVGMVLLVPLLFIL